MFMTFVMEVFGKELGQLDSRFPLPCFPLLRFLTVLSNTKQVQFSSSCRRNTGIGNPEQAGSNGSPVPSATGDSAYSVR